MNRYSYEFKAKKQEPANKSGVPEGMEEEDLALNDVEHCEACEIHEDKIKQVTEHMPDEDELYDLAELFKIFGDSTRIRNGHFLCHEAYACIVDTFDFFDGVFHFCCAVCTVKILKFEFLFHN